MAEPIADTYARPATPGEAAMADAALDAALATNLADETERGAQLTWAGLHALAALGAMLDDLVDELIATGYGNALLANLADVPSRAFAVIHLLDDRPELAARFLAPNLSAP